jgi:hypothetical protein
MTSSTKRRFFVDYWKQMVVDAVLTLVQELSSPIRVTSMEGINGLLCCLLAISALLDEILAKLISMFHTSSDSF